MKRFMLLITAIAAAYLSVPQAAAQGDSDLVWRVNPKPDYYISKIYLSPDGNSILAYMADYDNLRSGIFFFDIENGTLKDSIIEVGKIAGFSIDSKYIFTYYPMDYNKFIINKINLETKQIEKTTNFPTEIDSGAISKIGILPNGNLVATIYNGYYLYVLIDGNTFNVIDKVDYPTNCVSVIDMCLSPKGDNMALYLLFKLQSQNDPPKYYSKVDLWNINLKTYIRNIFPNNIPDFVSWKFFPDGIRIGLSISGKFKIIDIKSLDSVILYNTANEFAVSMNEEILYLGFLSNDIKALSNINYHIQCTSELFPDIIPTFIILSKDEKYFIVARGGKLLKIRNCYTYTGIIDNLKEIYQVIYPNPGTETFTYSNQELIDSSYSYEITSSTGQLLIKNKLLMTDGKGTFSVKNIPIGSYRFKLYAKDKVHSLSFIIDR